jgi:hypothetical protein
MQVLNGKSLNYSGGFLIFAKTLTGKQIDLFGNKKIGLKI